MKGSIKDRFKEIPYSETNSFFELPQSNETINPDIEYQESYYDYKWNPDGSVDIEAVIPAYYWLQV